MEARHCEITGQPFSISKEEMEAYALFDLPLPTICPQERCRRQLSFQNESQFFWRNCSATGEKIYSVFPADAPFPVVSPDYWWQGQWDPMDSGFRFDFDRLFIDQLSELWNKVPRPAYSMLNSVSTRASNNGCDVGSSFLVFNAHRVACCYYCVNIWDSSECVDCYNVHSCERCYDSVHCYDSSLLRWSEFCSGCNDSWFLSHCKSCQNCLFCANLEGKKFHVFNKPVLREEYYETLRTLTLKARPKVEQAKEQYNDFLADKPVPHIVSTNPKHTSGNYLFGCDRVYHSFECRNSKNLMHCHSLVDARDCIDGFGFGDDLSRSAQFVSVGGRASKIVNCTDCRNDVEDLTYCTFCESSSHLFACVGLRGKEYCIFNKQYSKQDYEKTVSEIREHLKSRGVWGKFFPASLSGFSYNSSSADEYMPLSKIPAKMMGFRWNEDEETFRVSQFIGDGDATALDRFSDVPERLEELTEETCRDAVFICELSGKPYRITKDELALYEVFEVAPPARGFEQRHRERLMRLSPRGLVRRESSKSGAEIRTAFTKGWRRPVFEYEEWSAAVKGGRSEL